MDICGEDGVQVQGMNKGAMHIAWGHAHVQSAGMRLGRYVNGGKANVTGLTGSFGEGRFMVQDMAGSLRPMG